MKDFLSGFTGKKVDVVCSGGIVVRGEIIEVGSDVLHLKDDEDKVCYVAVDKITVVWETKDKKDRTGFISGFSGKTTL